MSRRSGGVTAWAVYCILSGALGTAVVFAMARSPDVLWKSLDARIEAAAERLPSEEGTALRQRLETLRQDPATDVMHAPASQIAVVVSGLVSLSALLAGIGILGLHALARKVLVAQAGIALVLGVWRWFWWWPMYGLPVLKRYRELASSLFPVGSALAERMQESWRIRDAVQPWGSYFGLILVNGLVIWFFTRPSVKAQCARSA